MRAATNGPADCTRPPDRLTEPGRSRSSDRMCVWRPERLCLAPRLGLLVGMAENYIPEYTVPRAIACAWPNRVARRHGLAMQFTGLGSMLAVRMTDSPIRSAEDAERGLQSADQLRTSRRIANEARNINAAGVTPKTKIITPSTSLAPADIIVNPTRWPTAP